MKPVYFNELNFLYRMGSPDFLKIVNAFPAKIDTEFAPGFYNTDEHHEKREKDQ
jgi:hypothetical protein